MCGRTTSFSVVVPVHDDPFVRRCVTSLLSQGADVEVVLVDDGSVAGTAQVVDELATDARVRAVHIANGGPSAARNVGIGLATGEYVAFLDSDDEALPTWLATCAEVLARTDALLLFHGWEQQLADRVERRNPAELGPLFGHVRGTFLPGTFVVRRDVLVETGGYVNDLRYAENTELGLRLIDEVRRRGREPVVTDQALVRRYDNPTRDYDAARGDAARWLLEHHAHRFARDRRARSEHLAIVGVSEARLGHLAEARRWFLRSALADPADAQAWGRAALACVPALAARRWHRSPRATGAR